MGPTLTFQKERKGNVSLPINHPIVSGALKLETVTFKICVYPFFSKRNHINSPQKKGHPTTTTPYPPSTVLPRQRRNTWMAWCDSNWQRWKILEIFVPKCWVKVQGENIFPKSVVFVCFWRSKKLMVGVTYSDCLSVVIFFQTCFFSEHVNKVLSNRTIWRPEGEPTEQPT